MRHFLTLCHIRRGYLQRNPAVGFLALGKSVAGFLLKNVDPPACAVGTADRLITLIFPMPVIPKDQPGSPALVKIVY